MTASNRDATEKRDDATLTTIAEVAKACGVSKSTAARRLKELDLATVSDPSDRRSRGNKRPSWTPLPKGCLTVPEKGIYQRGR